MKHKFYEEMNSKIQPTGDGPTIDEQLQMVRQEALSNPSHTHPLGLAKKLYVENQGKYNTIATSSQIKNSLYNFRRELFLPTTLIDSCKLSKTYSNQSFCQKVLYFQIFLFIS